MKILITGAKGNLGTQLIKILEKKHQLTAWDKNDFDITKKELTKKKITNIKPDIIINTASYNAVDKCENNKKEYNLAYKLNAKIIDNLCSVALDINATLIHYSTDYVFNSSKKTKDFKENAKPNPINKYAQTKLMGEKIILKYNKKKLKYFLIRTSKLFGPPGNSKNAKPSFFDIILNLSKTKKEINIIDNELSCFTYTPDLAQATKQLLESKKKYGIYHIINTEPTTWYGAAKELFKILKINTKINPITEGEFPRPAKRPTCSTLLNTKLKPLRSYKKALKDYLK